MENKNQVTATMLDWTAMAQSFCFGIYYIGGIQTGYCGAVTVLIEQHFGAEGDNVQLTNE